ncbi:hypothetical protein E2562_038114, partial [Oryza meyeriana var. granulata]
MAGDLDNRSPELADGGVGSDATTTTLPTTTVPEPTPIRSTWRRPSQKGKPRLRLLKHATQRATAAAKLAKHATQRAAAVAEKAARRKQKDVEKAARRKQKALEKAARRQQKALDKAARKKRKAFDGGGGGESPVVRRKLDVDGEWRPPKRIDQPYSSRTNLIDNLRSLIALDLAGELPDKSPVSPEQPSAPSLSAEQPSTPPATPENPPPIFGFGLAELLNNLRSLAESQTLPAAVTSTAIVPVDLLNAGGQIKKKGKKPTMVDRLVMVPYRPKRVAGSAATGDEALAGALVLYNGPAWTPRWYVPRWTSERLVLSKLPPRSSLVVGLDAATKAVYNELMQREETSYGDDELDDVPGGPEWDERRREFKLKVDHFMPIVRNIIGDRKFSRWGGSVVTSIVGTFLTQNVTDNSSSNAFMTMAAKFPPKNCSNVKQNLD